MGASFVVVADPATDPVPGFGAGFESAQVDAFVFEGSPEPLDHPVVNPVATTVHRDLNRRIAQHVGKVSAGELGSLDALLRVKRQFGTD